VAEMTYEEADGKRWQLAENLARQYHFCVIPLYPFDYKDINKAGKVPCIKGWQKKEHTRLGEIETWEMEKPYHNLGLVLGGKYGVIAIDVDGEEGKEILEELSGGDIPETVTYKTPGGGMRYLYRVRKKDRDKIFRKYKKNGRTEHNECSLLGDGTQTVLPYSIHPNGGVYKFVKGKSFDDIKIAYVPEWMRNLMLRETSAPPNSIKQPKSVERREISEGLVGDDDLLEIFTKCPRLRELYEEQKEIGLDYDTWHNVTRLLAQIDGFQHYAMEFSELSSKHDDNSVKHIEELLDKYRETKGNVPTIRCTTFGCAEKDIAHCYGKLNYNDNKELTNSPANNIKSYNIYDEDFLYNIGIERNPKTKKWELNPNKFLRLFKKDNRICVIDTPSLRHCIFYRYSLKGEYWKMLTERTLFGMCRKLLHHYVPDAWSSGMGDQLRKVLPLMSKDSKRLERPTSYVNVKNGLFNVETFTLEEHRPEVFTTTRIPFIYKPEAKAPLFMKFLNDIFEEDQERIDLVQEMMGYCLCANTKAEKFFFLYGSGGNGKSVLLNVIKTILGKNNYSSLALERFNDKFAAAELIDKLANIADESESTIEMKTSELKRIASGNDIQGERKFQDAYSYKPFATLLFSFNNLPKTKDHSPGMKRKLVIIPFNRDFTSEGHDDTSLTEKLAEEKAGIFAFAMKGLERLQSERTQEYKGKKITLKPYHFSRCETVEIEHKRYFKVVDFHEAFLDACVKVIIDLNSQNTWKKTRINKEDMLFAFRAWSVEVDNREAKQEHIDTTSNKIRDLLKERGAYYNRLPKQCTNNNKAYYPNVEFTQRGLKLLEKGKRFYNY
jgi:putative DNA primase/helicase